MNNRWRWMISGVAVLLLTVFLPVRAAAAGELSRATTRGEEETRIRALVQTSKQKVEAVKQGLTNIQEEIKELEAHRVERLKKLQEDLESFQRLGTAGVSKENSFYLKRATGLTPYEIDTALEGTEMAGLGRSFYLAEKEFGVNSLFLVALANHESAYGSSAIARDKNNLFGFAAYDRSPYESAEGYATKGDSIRAVAEFLAENYLDPEGVFYHGVSTDGINVRYSSSSDWSELVEAHMERVAKKIVEELGNELP